MQGMCPGIYSTPLGGKAVPQKRIGCVKNVALPSSEVGQHVISMLALVWGGWQKNTWHTQSVRGMGVRSGAPVSHCVVCGYYGTSKCMGMQKPCCGKPVNNTRHKRFMENVHPHTKEIMWKRTPVPKLDAGMSVGQMRGARSQPSMSGPGKCLKAMASEPAKRFLDEPNSDWCEESDDEHVPGWV